MRGHHFQSRNKDGGHTIRFTISKTPICMQSSRLYLLQNRSYCRWKFYIAGIGNVALFDPVIDLDLDPMTFIYEHDPEGFMFYCCPRLGPRLNLTHRHTYAVSQKNCATIVSKSNLVICTAPYYGKHHC